MEEPTLKQINKNKSVQAKVIKITDNVHLFGGGDNEG